MGYVRNILMIIVFIIGAICFKNLNYPIAEEDISQNFYIVAYIFENAYIILGIIISYLLIFKKK
ncbi:hypothetical protein [Brochothrix thermosphacta]|nr:hypothetical protein [Brochothrix thermosphacta]ODJ60146.1 hypothetical protein BFR44_03660 [Brochothrix thermosphacta]